MIKIFRIYCVCGKNTEYVQDYYGKDYSIFVIKVQQIGLGNVI